ncbi:MAG TPA: DUF5939 domain-containing protein [Planctomycetota bacterium]|nr:DUF5939 domain-containing protein [Planctomycetota bacterium]
MEGARPIDGERLWSWEWQLAAPPEKVWPFVSDTQRVGKAIGFGPWNFKATPDARGGATRKGSVTALGVTIEWDEHTYEWNAPREMGVLRVYTRGPFAAIRQHVKLDPEGAGTRLTHAIAVKSHGILGTVTAALEVGRRTWIGLDRVYRGFDDYLKGTARSSFPEEPVVLADGGERILDRSKAALVELGYDAALVERILDLIRREPDRELARLRPFALARRLGVDKITLLRMFLHATKRGLLEMSWDLICPSCKGSQEATTELSRLKTDAHCESCNIKFDAQFDDSVEVSFRPSAAVRPITVADYCVGGPGNTRHLVAQRIVPRGATIELPLTLEPGIYRVRGPRNPGETTLEVEEGAPSELLLEAGSFPPTAKVAPKGLLRVANEQDKEHVVALERVAWKEDVASGTRVTCLQEFRDMFSSQVFAPDTRVGISSIALLFTDLKSSTAMYEKVGDAVAFALVRDHFKLLFESVSAEQGGLVKTIGDAVMASFPRPENALRAAIAMHAQIATFNEHEKPAFPIKLKVGLHAGPCIAVNLNERLDYFGTTVNMAARIQNESFGDDIVLLDQIARDPDVARVLASVSATREEFDAELKGLTGKFRLVRVIPARGAVAPAPPARVSTRFKSTNLFGTQSSSG